jgi:pimeloyl-ACP methyl ester carboxylesterase
VNIRAAALFTILAIATPAWTESRDTLVIRSRTQELHLYGRTGSPPIVLSSGDLGWAGFVVHVAEYLESRGYRVIGLDSRAYLSSFTSKTGTLRPEDVPADYRLLIDYAQQGSQVRPILVGISEGAGLSVLASALPDVKARVQGVLGLGLPDENELGWKWQDFTIWVTKRVPNEPSFMVKDIIGRVSPLPLAEIHSTHDEFLPLDQARALFARAGEPKRMWEIEAANHRFSNNRSELDRRLVEALSWIQGLSGGK